MFKCPHCNTPLHDVGVVVQATVIFSPESGYSSVNEIEDTLDYYCMYCGKTLPFKEADNYVYTASEERCKGGENDATRNE